MASTSSVVLQAGKRKSDKKSVCIRKTKIFTDVSSRAILLLTYTFVTWPFLIVTESEKVRIVSENIANLNKKGLYQ